MNYGRLCSFSSSKQCETEEATEARRKMNRLKKLEIVDGDFMQCSLHIL
jgi:hypothetical protein